MLRRSSTAAIDPAWTSVAEPITFPSAGGRIAHGLFYRPTNPDVAAPDGELPPLLVHSHGGPTSHAANALDLGIQLLTSRGIAVVDVDYGGSTGYGREYRRELEGNWGVVDVDDCEAAAQYLVARGDADPERLAIEGGSAGGYTTLAALAFRDTFAAGISLYGIGDLEALVHDDHKFESRYSDGLVGPYPEAAELYRERSPNHHLDGISCPVLVIQGLEDRVVPPRHAEAIVAALAANDIPHAYLAFEGEGHGFRGADAIRRTLEARLSFLGAVFGFTPADDLPPLEVPGLADWRAGRTRVAARIARTPAISIVPLAVTDPALSHDLGSIQLLFVTLAVRDRADLRRAATADRRPDPAAARRDRAEPAAESPGHRARAGGRVPAVPAADPLRRRVLHAHPGLQGQPARRSCCWRSGWSCSRPLPSPSWSSS